VSTTPPDAFVGLDLGTSGLKAVLCSATGEVLGRADARYPTSRPVTGAAQQDPAHWREAVRAVLADLVSVMPRSRWRCVGLSAMIPTLVTTDETGTPTGPAITWQDARGEDQATAMCERTGDLYQVTGQRLDGRYLLPMLARLAADEPSLLGPNAWMLGAKDYLYWWLTGAPATDPSTAAGTGAYELESHRWSEPMLAALEDLVPHERPRLPPVSRWDVRRTMRAELTSELGLPPGIEVCLGAADSVAAMVALGPSGTGGSAYVAGTSTVIMAASPELRFDSEQRYLVTPLLDDGAWGLEMDLLSTGSSLRWLAGLVGCGEEELVTRARTCDPLAAPTFLPFLSPGEQGALWDPDLAGSVTGLTLRHGSADLARGLLTGVLLESRRCLGVLAEATSTAGAVHLGGGGMATPEFAQELADATGRQVLLSELANDHSAVGAALMAARSCAVGPHQEPSTPAGRLVSPDRRAEPMWDLLARRHEGALVALRTQGEPMTAGGSPSERLAAGSGWGTASSRVRV
jgi:gluconokinase/xylulokinase